MNPAKPQSGDSRGPIYQFGGFTLDLGAGLLYNHGEEVSLRAKSFQVLAYLAQHAGRLVTKAELINAVWPDAAVTDNSLSQCLADIRRALNDESQQCIRTVARRGYLFSARVTAVIPERAQESAPIPISAGVQAKKSRSKWLIAVAIFLLAAAWLVVVLARRTSAGKVTYTQITNFTDSAVAPVLSPDGRILAFIRGSSFFTSTDQIYVKMLPDGEPVQLTDDGRPKFAPAFSPDGSQIAFSLVTKQEGWSTYIVPTLGGQPRLFFPNASGLTWIDRHKILFSEVKTGWHMGIVTATDARMDSRDVYWPENVRGMAHYSYASPDLKWALLVEMDPVWQPCRLVPMDGSSRGGRVGPAGACTSAAWSPDGKWMYFGVETQGSHHLWRARFPDGVPEQLTSGPTEEDGIAMEPDGRSLITSIGTRQSELWSHDSRGEYRLSSEGFVPDYALESEWFGSSPVFSKDGRHIYYLLRRELPESPRALWRADIETGRNTPVLTGFSIDQYDISSDGNQIVFSTKTAGAKVQIWLGSIDRAAPPKLIASSIGTAASPHFDAAGDVLFRDAEGSVNYLYRIDHDGSRRAKLVPYPVSTVESISPDHRWIVAMVPNTSAIPTSGGAPVPVCTQFCAATWSPDGGFLYVVTYKGSQQTPGKTVAIPIPPGEALPKLPAAGIASHAEAAAIPGAQVIERAVYTPGPGPDSFAYVKKTSHRNLFRITLP